MTRILAGYLADRKGHVASHATLEYAAAALRATLGDLTPQHVTTERVRHYTRHRRSQGRADGTIIRELVTLRAALRWGIKQKWFEGEPHIEVPRSPPSRDRWLSREEADRLLDAAGAPHIRLFIALALYTAARRGAILAMRWVQVDLERKRIALGRGVGNKGRATVPIAEPLMPELLTGLELRTTDYVIEFNGEPVANVKTGFNAAARRAELPGVTPHVLRHTAATWMAQRGVSLGMIAQFLGNSAAITERVYAHHHPDHLAAAVEALAGFPRQLAEKTTLRKAAKRSVSA